MTKRSTVLVAAAIFAASASTALGAESCPPRWDDASFSWLQSCGCPGAKNWRRTWGGDRYCAGTLESGAFISSPFSAALGLGGQGPSGGEDGQPPDNGSPPHDGGTPPDHGGPPDKGGPKGNNGVGNGVDGQPPGDPPVNDAQGTGPGNPGNRGGPHS